MKQVIGKKKKLKVKGQVQVRNIKKPTACARNGYLYPERVPVPFRENTKVFNHEERKGARRKTHHCDQLGTVEAQWGRQVICSTPFGAKELRPHCDANCFYAFQFIIHNP
ncbi:MAG: hypothetical protein D5S00_10040 [Tindallia sp. MSAO_Bac2]|nr:MAG: hypothetical protein D5S00_10040 [Tindallia sp. MSAO_Bac2]